MLVNRVLHNVVSFEALIKFGILPSLQLTVLLYFCIPLSLSIYIDIPSLPLAFPPYLPLFLVSIPVCFFPFFIPLFAFPPYLPLFWISLPIYLSIFIFPISLSLSVYPVWFRISQSYFFLMRFCLPCFHFSQHFLVAHMLRP